MAGNDKDKLKATVLEHPALVKVKLSEHEKNIKIEKKYGLWTVDLILTFKICIINTKVWMNNDDHIN